MALVPVEFLPGGAIAWVEPGVTVLEAARAAGHPIPAPCGGRGVCGACGVQVVSGELEAAGPVESTGLRRAPASVRLACQARIVGPVSVKPLVAHPAHDVAAERRGQSTVAAVDLGTTSVTVVALDAATGREVGRCTVPNAQQAWGADVLSRVSAAIEGQADALRHAAESSVLSALACAADPSEVTTLVIAANSTMAALLTGADVSVLATAPFRVPVISPLTSDSALVQALAMDGAVSVVPPISAFVGGDIVAGLIAVDAISADGSVALIDMGTNAEVAVVHEGRLTVASAPAGPAFEGAGLSCGGLAVPGAVTRVSVTGSEVVLEVMGDEEAGWLSGAGVISAVAALRRAGHILPDGAFVSEGPLAARFDVDEAGVAGVWLADTDRGVRLTQLDVRSFQLAKAAVAVALSQALAEAGLGASDLDRLWIAGAFGQAVAIDDLVELGIIPRVTAVRARFAGNTALQGATTLAMRDRMGDVEELIGSAHAVELAADAGFGEHLISALALEPLDL